MKKSLFWKIMAILFFVWLCLLLWVFSIKIDLIENGLIIVKTNMITGKVHYMSVIYDDDWNEPGRIKDKKNNIDKGE